MVNDDSVHPDHHEPYFLHCYKIITFTALLFMVIGSGLIIWAEFLGADIIGGGVKGNTSCSWSESLYEVGLILLSLSMLTIAVSNPFLPLFYSCYKYPCNAVINSTIYGFSICLSMIVLWYYIIYPMYVALRC